MATVDPKMKEVLVRAIKSGKFGDSCSFVDIVPSDILGEDHFASAVIFAEIKVKNSSDYKNFSVVIKRQQKDAHIRDMMNTDAQFYNEVLMYDDILPVLDKSNILQQMFPKCIYGNATLGQSYDEDILIIEDLRQFGYRLAQEKLFLDFDHCALALKKLGQFHALSYSMKQENLEQFLRKVGKLKDTRYEHDDSEETNRFLSVSMERGILPLVNAGVQDAALKRLVENLRDPFHFMKGLCQPEEPTAVLCHGDFCRNNMLFKYDDDKKPADVRLFDIATARYASPAIDLSFFLYLNTSAEMRNTRMDDLLQVYHDSLRSAIPGCRVPSLDIIRLELSRKAPYGYVLCSFFLPMMMDPDSKTDLEEFSTMKPEEIDNMSRTRGGELGTKYITDIVKHIIYLDNIVR